MADEGEENRGDGENELKGGPGDEGGTQKEENRGSTLQTVTIGGKTFQMEPEVAASIQAEQTSYQEQVSTAEAATLAVEVAGKEAPGREQDADEGEGTGIADLMFTDPEAYDKQLRESIKTDIRAEYQQDQARQTFWDEFYRENTDLADKKWMVEGVLARRLDSIGKLSGRPGRDKLAELTKGEILGLIESTKGVRVETAEELEGGTGGSRGGKEEEDKGEDKATEIPDSISDVIKARSRARSKTRAAS